MILAGWIPSSLIRCSLTHSFNGVAGKVGMLNQGLSEEVENQYRALKLMVIAVATLCLM
jgi:hypothetical protein